ncbi:uncharacterized protein LOC110096020 [Dendrobium catenatum]|uniref:DUF2232 domain-containing protein n=1 Tax=Dendrobium catenatum TaxID=906689 RepID=A0A2I0XDG1_9ASPA|nr:uncharacterized protein LOC110096020 [Dendrobium catenatum]PKU85939.1 hypothetical protein MA16_Dca001770 [Dendrobium catenatum]
MSPPNLPHITGLSSYNLPQIFHPLRFRGPQILLSIVEPAKNLLYSSYTASPKLDVSLSKHHRARVSLGRADERLGRKKECEDEGEQFDDLGVEGEVFQKTLRLVECSMFASVTGLAYFLSNSLAIENYLGCFFSLPIVISSMRWGLAAGRKTMVATAMLLFILSGPVKASTYLLMHGLVGLAMGSLWRLRVNWNVSLALCTLVRVIGVVGYVLVTSFLIRENILNLITINVHASLTYVLAAIGVNIIPTMDAIYVIFGTLVLLNCGFFVLLLHILYAVFLTKLGMKASLALPGWLQKAV